MSRNTLASLICMSLSLSVANTAWAQDPEAAGSEGGAGAGAGSEGTASGSLSLGGSTDSGGSASATSDSSGSGSGSDNSGSSTTTTNTDAVAASTVTGPTDHAAVVGKWGVGYLGYRTMSYATGAGAGGGIASVDAPVIGVRYWMDPSMGLDLGLGLSIATGSTTVEAGGMSTDTDAPEPFVVIVHGGIPLALANSRHFTFQIVPELNIGYAANTVDQGGEDLKQRGFHVDLGARAGAEIQFGFLDMPELSLQAGIGVALAIDNVSAELGDASFSQSRTSFGTSSGENPWQIFSTNLAAIYYFGG
jgi:hypothetical protein